MPKFWRRDGKFVRCPDGRFAFTEVCPCDDLIVTDCLPEGLPAVLVIDQTWLIRGMTVQVAGTFTYDALEGGWLGDLTWTMSGGDCDLFPTGPTIWEDVLISCDGTDFNLSGDEITGSPVIASAAAADPAEITFLAVQSAVLCDALTEDLDLEFTE